MIVVDRKGKGRAKSPQAQQQHGRRNNQISIDLSDSEDLEMLPSKDKGKGKAVQRSPSPPPQILDEDDALQLILSIVPTVLPSHVLMLLRSEDHKGSPDSVVECLLKNKDWPKAPVKEPVEEERREKRRREEDDKGDKHWLDTKARNDVGIGYKKEALVPFGFVLETTFDRS